MKRLGVSFLAAVLLAAQAAIPTPTERPSQQPPQAPQIEAQQRSENGVGRQQAADSKSPTLENDTCENQCAKPSEEPKEVAFFGVKPGEWLIAGATLLLWYATMRLVWDAKAASQRQLRAYVFPKPIELRDFGEGETPRLVIKIQNFGQTPAYKFKQASRGGYVKYPLTDGPPDTRDEHPETQPLAPTGYILAQPVLKSPLTKEQIAAIASKKMCIMFVGQIDYTDAFGKERWVKYCFYSGGDDTLGNVNSYKGHNSTSEDAQLRHRWWQIL
jgi:hypothetical protein